MNDNNNNGNDDDNNNNNNNGQQHLLTRLPQYALKRRRIHHPNKKKKRKKQKQEQYAPKFPIGTKISITDSVLYRTYDHKIDIRLDGTIEGYERVHFNTANADDDDDDDDDDEVIDKYAWHYVVRFIDHEHLFEDQDQESDEEDDDDEDEEENDNDNDNENEEVAGDGDDNDEKVQKDRAQAIQNAVARAEVYNSIAGVNVNVDVKGRPPSSSNDATASSSFLKVMPEQDIADSLARDDVSYIIDQYFGRNLRELLQVQYTSGTVSDHSSTVLREYRQSLSHPTIPMMWASFLEEVKMCPNMARARFPLYDSTGDTIGDFTVLAMAVIVLLLNQGSRHNELDGVAIIAKLLEVYPKGIQQGIYHNRNRQLAGGSKYLGILQFIMEFDTHEDHYQRYQQRIRSQQNDENGEKVIAKKEDLQPRHERLPHYFATLIHPDILKLFITSPVMNNYGQYLSTEFCPSFQKPMPLHRLMYSAWVTHKKKQRYRTAKQHITAKRHDSKIQSIDEWLSRSCTCNKVKVPVEPFLIDDSILSPQVKMILQNNWQAVTFLLCEQIVGTMNYSRTVLNYLLYECIQNSSESTNTKKNENESDDTTTSTTPTNTVEAIFGGYIQKGGGGIVKWFNANNNAARKQNGGRRMTRLHVPNSFIALLFKYITPYNQAVFHSCLQLYVHQQRQLLPVPPMVSTLSTTITPTTTSTVTTTTPSMTTPGTESESDIDTTTPTKDMNANTNATKLLACVLDALAIVQRNMVALPYQPLSNSRKGTTTTTTITVPPQRSNDIIIKHCKIIGSMWKQYYQTFWTTTAATARHDSFSSTSLLTTLFSSSSSSDDSDRQCHDHPLYTAIRRNHPFRPIVQDVLNLDKSVLFDHSTPPPTTTTTTSMSSSSSSSTSINVLPPFAYAATNYCSQSLVEPVLVVPLSTSTSSSLTSSPDSTSTSTTTTTHDDDVTAIERIYELLRANPAAILSTTRRTATATVTVAPPLATSVTEAGRRRRMATKTTTAAAATTTTTTPVIPTVTPSKQPPPIRSDFGGEIVQGGGEGGAHRKRTTTTHNTTVTPDTKRMRMK